MAAASLAGTDPTTRWRRRWLPILGGLPPLGVLAGTAELLLSDAERLASAATRAGVQITRQLGEGLPHAYPVMLGTPRRPSRSRGPTGTRWLTSDRRLPPRTR